MNIKTLAVLVIVLPMLACSDEKTASNDSMVESRYEDVCSTDPFNGRTQGLYKGVFVDEYALSRCEFEVEISIDTVPTFDEFCSQRGTLSYIGTQTFVHPTEPRECGSISSQVSLLWYPSNINQETGVVINDDIEFPIRFGVGFESLPPTLSDSGNQLEQLLNLGWTYFNQNGNISFVAPGNPDELYEEFVRQ
jgi:hypothetical protein